MFIQSRTYKYFDETVAIRHKVEAMPESSKLKGKWLDDHNFIVKKKGLFPMYSLKADISEVKEHWRLKIKITADSKLPLVFLLPLVLALLGLLKGFPDGMFFLFAGFSLFVFLLLYNSENLHALKRDFKEALHIL